MILRRLAASIRRQDWLAVIIEFVIVVTGIFVGLSATDWREARDLRAREHAYLERLHEDMQAMSESMTAIRERKEGRKEAVLRTLRALETCEPERANDDDFRRTFTEYQNQQSIPVVERTYREMVASGALAAMADRDLSGDIADTFSGLDSYRRFIDSIRVSLPVVDQIVWQRVDLSYDQRGVPVLAAYDFDSLCRDRELRNAVAEIYDLAWDWETLTRRTAGQIDAMAATLDRHLADR